MKRLLRTLGAICTIVAAATTHAQAQDFPSEPIKVWLGSGSGGMTDLSVRILTGKMEEILGTRFIVDNRPGGGGSIARSAVFNEPHDGYTMTDFSTNHAAAAVLLDADLDLDDLAVIGGYMPQERVLFASGSAPFDTMQEMIDYAKTEPVTFAFAGVWPSRVVQGFAKEKGLNIRMVPFTSGADASAALLGGHVMLAETGVGTAVWTAARDGDQVKMLSTLSDRGLDQHGFPDVPMLADFDASNLVDYWFGFALPADVPEERIAILSDALHQALEDPTIQEQLRALDLTPEWVPPAEYRGRVINVHSSARSLKALLDE